MDIKKEKHIDFNITRHNLIKNINNNQNNNKKYNFYDI